jgi:hypothetical protein
LIGKLAGSFLFSVAAVLRTAVPASAAEPVSVQSFTHEGSGCPAGTVSSIIALDGSSFSLLFDSYIAEVGPAVPASRRTQDCFVDLVLKAPLGWSWAIAGVDHRGFASLASGVSATLKSSFLFNRQRADQRQAPSLETHFIGPMQDDYAVSTDTPPLQIEWSKCGGLSHLHMRTSLKVKAANPAGPGLVTVDSLDGHLTQLDGTTVCGYRLVWRRCD